MIKIIQHLGVVSRRVVPDKQALVALFLVRPYCCLMQSLSIVCSLCLFRRGRFSLGQLPACDRGKSTFTWIFQVGWIVSFYLENPLLGQIILPTCGRDDGVDSVCTPRSPLRTVRETEDFNLVSLLGPQSLTRPATAIVCQTLRFGLRRRRRRRRWLGRLSGATRWVRRRRRSRRWAVVPSVVGITPIRHHCHSRRFPQGCFLEFVAGHPLAEIGHRRW